jgi:hypothetical protein
VVQIAAKLMLQTMRTEPVSYFKNEPLQARYRMLLAQRGGYGSSILEEPAKPLVPLISRKEFVAQTGSERHYGEYMKLVRTAADWVFALPDAERSGFVASLEALPQPVQLAAIAEIIERVPIVEPSSPTALANFAKMPEGAVLMREGGRWPAATWHRSASGCSGSSTAWKNATCRRSCAGSMGCPPTCAIALYRKLACSHNAANRHHRGIVDFAMLESRKLIVGHVTPSREPARESRRRQSAYHSSATCTAP